MTYTGRENLGTVAIVVVDATDDYDELESVLADVVEAADERREVAGACFRSKYCLAGREYECAVGANTFAAEFLDGLDAVFYHWNFHNDLVVDLRQLFSFLD